MLRSETTFDSQGRTASEITNLRQLADGTIDRTHARTTVPTYDPFGNVVKTIFPDGSFVSATFDERGRKLSQSDQLGQTTNFIYDSLNRLTSTILPPVTEPGTQNVPARPTYSFEYDSQGNQTLIRDPYGRETRFTYDEQGRQLTRTLPLGFGVDGREGTGDDSAVTPGDFTETFEYDERGRRIRHVTFEGVVHTFEYDPATGRLASEQFFDNLNQYDNGNGTPTEVWSSAYDHLGREIETEIVSVAGSRTYSRTFDFLGRVTGVTTPKGTVSYTYDLYGRKSGTIIGTSADPSTETNLRYDAFGRVEYVDVVKRNGVVIDSNSSVAGNQPESTRYRYDLLGLLDRTDLANGIVTDYLYDSLNRLQSLIDYSPDSTPEDLSDNSKLAQFDYQYRADGKRTSEVSTVWDDGVGKVNTFEWDYDGNGRLTDEVFTSFDELLSQTQHFQLDLAGNRIEQTLDLGNDATIDETTAYVYDANDRLLTETAGTELTEYGYDFTEQTSKVVTDTSTQEVLRSEAYTWTLQDRMASVTITEYASGAPSSVQKFDYGYDAKGIRTSATLSLDPTASGTLTLSSTTEYVNDEFSDTGYSQVLQETTFDANGNATAVKVYTFGHQRISQTTFDAAHPTGQTAFFLTDGHGSTRVLADAIGAMLTIAGIKQIFVYDAYGNMVNIQVSQAGTTFLYSGENFDWRTGMQDLRARLYNIRAGRFVSSDDYTGNQWNPISYNKYLYTHSDPVNGVDPSGRTMSLGMSMAILGGATGLVGGVVIQGARSALHNNSGRTIAYDAFIGGAAGVAIGATLGYTVAVGGAAYATAWGLKVAEGTKVVGLLAAQPFKLIAAYGLADAIQRKDTVDVIFESVGFISIYGGTQAASYVMQNALGKLPLRMSRVVRKGHYDTAVNNGTLDEFTMSPLDSKTTLLTGEADLIGISSADDLARRVSFVNDNGTPKQGPWTIITFDAPEGIVPMPIVRDTAKPGWTLFQQGGFTKGNAREFQYPNMPYKELKNVTTKTVE